ncbi:23S rRNA (adenine(2030)-N(6))-methyltransferase RlmJ [Aliihoeflea aestuarii]|uniref:23S rRNA (adenine(2030)-N(6))-methyltransferase RlmJ n=1 Tax=Aliihoeflea aestuarii TaxID=453840 RepID=UPI002096113D|nr:23S rRNA (adenine(2030)-N(6))-methyltransferase RlmJ [Aliihoeflea aestuarii]MCO6392745.1 23S rRNA (adenine(2030)-N(6))-methyltransferase RlmJ [Aliihoeflea aestuarii]
MNYRHIYHAGNFADVVKHVVLARTIEYLKRKPGAFRVIDTHAGIGVYDLSSPEAQKTGEWHGGIGKLLDAAFPAEVAALLAPYLGAVRAANLNGGLKSYPGSPAIARHLLRPQDRLTAIEMHPADARRLKERFAGDYQARIIELDGWLALGAHLPPKEKRGLVIVDPPFEKEGEFERIADGLIKAHKRWPGGTYLLWYPIKNRRAVAGFRETLRKAGIPKVLDIAFSIRAAGVTESFDGTGMIAVNPPYPLENELGVILPELCGLLGEAPDASFDLEWLAGEHVPS